MVPELDKCPKCSAENLSGSRFCNSCGARLDSGVQLRRVDNIPVRRKGNQGVALIGLGILFLFGAYLAYEHQECYRYEQIFGVTYCLSTWYPFRTIGLFIGLLGFVTVFGGLVVVGRGERS